MLRHAQYLNHLPLYPNQHNLQPMSIHIDRSHWGSADYGNIIFRELETGTGGQASHVKAKPSGGALVTKTSDSVGWIPSSWLKQWYPPEYRAPGISDSFHFIKVHTEHCVNLPAEQISRLAGTTKLIIEKLALCWDWHRHRGEEQEVKKKLTGGNILRMSEEIL